MILSISIPGGAVLIEPMELLSPGVAPYLIEQIRRTHTVPVLPDGVRVRFERTR